VAAGCGMRDLYGSKNMAAYSRCALLHDPCVIACLMEPGLFDGREMRVDIEIDSGHCLGRTVCDMRGRSGRPANARVMERIDADGFFALLTERLARLPGRRKS